jgi:peroxiredoxin
MPAAPAASAKLKESVVSGRLTVGARVEPRILRTIHGREHRIPDAGRLTHLQFRRFAGCPVCNLHLQSFRRRSDELARAGIQELILFHSTREQLLDHAPDERLAIVADPKKTLYRRFGVESGVRAVLDPRAWPTIVRAVAATLGDMLFRGAKTPPLDPEGGRYGLPADFLIDAHGVIRACHYGAHADDQWSVDELLDLALGPAGELLPASVDGRARA